MLKYLGMLAIFIASVMPAFEYAKRHRRKIAEYELFIRLADGLYEQISTYMRPISDFLSEFDFSPISDLGLKFSSRCDFGAEFSRVLHRLSVSDTARSALAEFFSALGGSAKEDELRRLLALRQTLAGELECDKRSSEKSLGVHRAVCCAVGLILVIVLM